MSDLQGKVAIVTGALRGIGRATAMRLASAGCRVAITDLRAPEAAAEDLAALTPLGIRYFQSNAGVQAEREALIAGVVEAFGRVDILVNNAGMAPRVRLDTLETTEESMDLLMAVNMKGPFFLCQLAAKQMIKQGGGGTIVNVASCSSYMVSVNRAEYCISKAAVSMATQVFAARLAGEGILVYEVRPGIIKTDMTAAVQEKYDKLFAQGITPMPYWGLPENVAEAVCVLAEGRLPYSTGEVINVDGGLHIPRL